MTTAKIQTSFASGEISPTLWGRVDLAKFHVGAATLRNMYVDYRGGASSRGGTKFVAPSLTPGTSLPPRLIPFTFNVQSGETYILEFGDKYLRFIQNGGYVLESSTVITNIYQSSPVQITAPGHGLSNGDWVYVSNVSGMTQINGAFGVVSVIDSSNVSLIDSLGYPISALSWGAYLSGGTIARVYTLSSPYAIADLPLLKFDQSADVMTICHTSYPPHDLKRLGAANWSLTAESFATTILPPWTGSAAATVTTGSNATRYQYVVTSVDAQTGQESVASPVISCTNSVNISSTAGSIAIRWAAIKDASQYNIYKAEPSYGVDIPVGCQFGYMTTTKGAGTVDNNIVADFTNTPPLHQNPFATSSISYIELTIGGTGYHQASCTVTISSSTGSGAVIIPVVDNGASSAIGALTAFIVVNAGEGYAPSDAVVISDGGAGGYGAAAVLNLNPAAGTWPGVVAYFQQRRVYAHTANRPDTYFFSKPGAFLNFDISSPTIDSDAIIGTPWSTQVNGISWMVSMPGGLVVLTGLGAWQVSGGTNGAAVTPASQNAQPQAYNGCSNAVPPMKIDYDILYVQQKGSQVYDLAYNFFTNIYTGADITIVSSHLFEKKSIREWTWSRAPHKIMWAVQTDGGLLSLTFLKDQEVQGWARHDTKGLFQSIASVSEGAVDAVYFVVKRYVRNAWVYYIERLDDRQWETIDDAFAVDCGLRTTQTCPNATLTPQASSGPDVIFTTDNAAFTAANVGDVIRVGNGMATVTTFVSAAQVRCSVINYPITHVIPNDPNLTPIPAPPGGWSISTPITTAWGLNHLEGETVSILADGAVITPQVVTNGSITLPDPASSIVIGLPYTCQLQSLYADVEGGPTIQGKRKNLPAVTVRIAKSRGFKVGSNQADASTKEGMDPQVWNNLIEVKDRNALIHAGYAVPLYTGDKLVRINPTWRKPGQVCVQQDYCLPLTVSALIPELVVGDDNG